MQKNNVHEQVYYYYAIASRSIMECVMCKNQVYFETAMLALSKQGHVDRDGEH